MTTDDGMMFDRLVESALQQVSTRHLTIRGLCRLKVAEAPERKARPDIERSIAMVPDDLRKKLRGLILGELPWPLYIHGPSGTGKTCASLVALDYLGRDAYAGSCSDTIRPWLAGFVDVRTIAGVKIGCDKGKVRWSDGEREEAAKWETVLKVIGRRPLVVFEEIGVGKEAADFRLDTMLEMLDRRANQPVKPFIVTSNLKPSEVEQVYDDRVADRILCGTIHKMEGASRRMP